MRSAPELVYAWTWPGGEAHRARPDRLLEWLRLVKRQPIPTAHLERRVVQVRLQLRLGAF